MLNKVRYHKRMKKDKHKHQFAVVMINKMERNFFSFAKTATISSSRKLSFVNSGVLIPFESKYTGYELLERTLQFNKAGNQISSVIFNTQQFITKLF